MIGTTEWVECKEKALGIIADWLWVLALIIGGSIGVIQGEQWSIALVYWNSGKRLIIYCILAQGKIVELEN